MSWRHTARRAALSSLLIFTGVTALSGLTGCATGPVPKSAEVATTAPAGDAKAPATQPASARVGGPGVNEMPSVKATTDPALDALIPITPDAAPRQVVLEVAAPAHLWERIRRGYGIPNLESDLVRDREQWYATRSANITLMAERSRKYLFHIVEELERRNMPSELALLPFVESAFNPQALSSAKASGMWQFIPSTGKQFELKQNMFRDDRRDVLASTRAALDYLQKLYGMFGDWQLALAAYNWGEGSVQRAMARNQKAGLPTTYSDLNMPMETRMYIPKLQALKNIVTDPASLKVDLLEIPNHPYFQQVPITRDIDVELAAKLAEVNLEDFKALNPSANRPVILAAGTPQILLPWDNATVFQQNLEAHASGRLASWTAWTAPSTMTPAEAARLTGMSEASFRAVNGVPPRMLVKAGSTLLVPRDPNRPLDVTLHVADNAQLSLTPEVVLKKTSVKALKADTVVTLAKRFNVSAASVAEWNKVSMTTTFKPGQMLTVFLPVNAVVAKRPPTPGRKTRIAAKR